MKKVLLYQALGIMAAAVMASCGGNAGKQAEKTVMETVKRNLMTQQEIDAGVFTPEVMWKMDRMGSAIISPDGGRIVYVVTRYNMAENKGFSALCLVTPEDGTPVQLTDFAGHDSEPSWSADGKSVYFLSDRSGSGQVWRVDPASKVMTQISDVKDGVEGYGISSKGDKAFYIKKVQVEKRASSEIFPEMAKSQALIYDDLMARHWNYWDRGIFSHIFLAPVVEGKIGEGRDIMEGEPWDAPMAPYFDNAEIAWNNAGTVLGYTCKKLTGRDYALSTNSNIYLYDTSSGTTVSITEGKGMYGYDKYPVFSPDDSKVAFRSMERPGNESDKERLLVYDIPSGSMSYLTRNFDYNAENVLWENDGSLLFIAPIQATYQICRADLDGNVKMITSGDHDITSLSVASDGRAVATLTTISTDNEIYNVDLASGTLARLTDINGHIYDNVKMGEVQKRWVRTTDGKQMLTWVILPPGFDPAKKYPLLLYCQGGPQSVVSQRWSYRWNFQLMASQGYIVVAPNRRGLPSFGQEWLDQISGDYSGQNIRDYLSAIDDVSSEPWADRERMGCVGASYGGYSAFFLAGNHNKRFKAFISHCGIFNFESMYGSTEELFFPNNDYGGNYWSDSPVARRSYANSPHRFVRNWDTPILIITGLNDYRVPFTQSLEAFTAARLMDVPARLMVFENEAHQVFKPQNSIVWNKEFFGWLDKYVKNAEK